MVTLAYATSGGRLAAEDIAQEAFVAACRDWDRIGRLDNPAAWVRRVVINRSVSSVRRRVAYLGATFEKEGGDAEVPVWSGGGPTSLRKRSIDSRELPACVSIVVAGTPGLAAEHSSNGSRVFIVGGGDGYTMEIDLQFPEGADREAVVAFATSLRLVDQSTSRQQQPEIDHSETKRRPG